MQKGLATLEMIFAIMIIGVLVKVAVPNVARILDTAALDYETKKLYSELRFIQEMNKSSTIEAKGMGNTTFLTNNLGTNGQEDIIWMFTPKKNFYQISRRHISNRTTLREPHYLFYGVTISFKKAIPENIISFDTEGKAVNAYRKVLSNTLILTSRLGKKRYIIFDSVGRMRASFTPAKE